MVHRKMLKYPGFVVATRNVSGIIDGLDRRGEGARLVDGTELSEGVRQQAGKVHPKTLAADAVHV